MEDERTGAGASGAAAPSASDVRRDALASTGIGVWTWRPAVDELRWTDEALTLLAVSPTTLPRSMKQLLALVAPGDRASVDKAIEAAASARREIAVEFRLASPAANPRWLLLRGRAESQSAPGLECLRGIVADITDWKRADESLRLNEERYRTLVYASADVVWTMSGDGGPQVEERLLGLEDRTWSTFTGQDAKSFARETWIEAVHPDDRARADAVWQTALNQGDSFEIEYRLRRRDGVYRVMFDRGVPLRDDSGRIVQWIGAAVDMTERNQLLAAVAAERSLLTAVLDQLPAGVVIAEAPSGRTILNNHHAAEILGYQPIAAAALDHYARYTAIHADGRRYAAEEYPLVRAISHAETIRDEEVRFIRGDGQPGILSVSAAPIRHTTGDVVAGVAIYFDLTERTQEEEHQRFLAAASAALASSLDYETAIRDLVGLIVPTIADACVVDIVDPSGAIQPLAVAANPQTQATLDELRRRFPATMDRQVGVAQVIATGQPSFQPVINDERRRTIARDAEHERLLIQLGTRSNITVAMRARGEMLGAMTLKRITSTMPYTTADLGFAEELARRTALALDNTRLLREARAAVSLRDDFLSSATHDLKNPLTTIQGRLQLLRRRMERGEAIEPGLLSRGLREIAAAAQKLQGMIDELQDVSCSRSAGR